MNTESPFFVIDTMLHLRHMPPDSGKESYPDLPEIFSCGADQTRLESADLAACIRETSLEQSQPTLLQELSGLIHRAEPLLPEVEDALDGLKELFLLILRDRLSGSAISLEERLVLGIDNMGQIRVMDEEHQKFHELERVLRETPELGQALREIARQTLLLRGVQDIEIALSDRLEYSEHTSSSYRVCLKGALSHFYFAAV